MRKTFGLQRLVFLALSWMIAAVGPVGAGAPEPSGGLPVAGLASPSLSVASEIEAVRASFGAGYAAHVARVRALVGDEPLTVMVQPPFVLIGDEPVDVLEQRRETLAWTVDQLRGLYFESAPPKIYDFWLFQDKKSYRAHGVELFGGKPPDPFGFSPAIPDTMVINIDVGEATLTHEIVRLYLEADFPRAPAWLKEGLTTLYEHSGRIQDRLRAQPDWRLTNVQAAIRASGLEAPEVLMVVEPEGFHRMKPDVRVAHARYLCLYLEQRELLSTYYKALKANAGQDRFGITTFSTVAAMADAESVRADWERFVLELSYP